MTSESLRCLTCPHAASCGHLHAAGRSSGLKTRRSHHTSADMEDYRKMVHEAISPDGQHMKLKGKSRGKIAWSAVRAVWGVGSMRTRAAVDSPQFVGPRAHDSEEDHASQGSLHSKAHPQHPELLPVADAPQATPPQSFAAVLRGDDNEHTTDSTTHAACDKAADAIARRFRSPPNRQPDLVAPTHSPLCV